MIMRISFLAVLLAVLVRWIQRGRTVLAGEPIQDDTSLRASLKRASALLGHAEDAADSDEEQGVATDFGDLPNRARDREAFQRDFGE